MTDIDSDDHAPGAEAREPAYLEGGGRPRPVPPGLHFVATPIGTARDITLRALDTLAGADLLAAEDTRTLRHLMEIHGIALNGRSVLPYHDHNGAEMRPKILAALSAGKSVAYASEAGTPLVADPGYQLGRAAIEADHKVWTAPGPSAPLAALTVSGLASDRFLFAGFPPPAGAARRSWCAELAGLPATIILFESPKRVRETLGDLAATFGEGRQAAICRELTKRYEEVLRGTVGELRDRLDKDPKGEIVLVIDRAREPQASAEDLETALRQALAVMRVKDAAAVVAESLGLPKRDVYQAALRLGRGEEG